MWPIWFSVVADIVVADIVAPRCQSCQTRIIQYALAAVPLYDAAFQMTRFVKQSHGHGLTSSP